MRRAKPASMQEGEVNAMKERRSCHSKVHIDVTSHAYCRQSGLLMMNVRGFGITLLVHNRGSLMRFTQRLLKSKARS